MHIRLFTNFRDMLLVRSVFSCVWHFTFLVRPGVAGLPGSWDSLLVKDEVLYRLSKVPALRRSYQVLQFLQLVLSEKLRREYIERLHADLVHFGQSKTCDAVARTFDMLYLSVNRTHYS